MRERFALAIPRAIFAAIRAQAEAELPNECCGLLAGRIPEPGEAARVTHRFPLVNSLHSPVRFLSEPRGMFEAIQRMRELTIEVLAVYHSHPTSAPVPSATDLEWNYGGGTQALIVGKTDGNWLMRSWWLEGEGFEEAECRIDRISLQIVSPSHR